MFDYWWLRSDRHLKKRRIQLSSVVPVSQFLKLMFSHGIHFFNTFTGSIFTLPDTIRLASVSMES